MSVKSAVSKCNKVRAHVFEGSFDDFIGAGDQPAPAGLRLPGKRKGYLLPVTSIVVADLAVPVPVSMDIAIWLDNRGVDHSSIIASSSGLCERARGVWQAGVPMAPRSAVSLCHVLKQVVSSRTAELR